MSGLNLPLCLVYHHHQAPSATPPSSASACYAVTARCRARMRLPTGSRHSQRVAATLLSYRRLRYAGSTATTSATLRVSVTRTAAARYSVTRYSEPGPVCAILSYLLTRSRRRHVRPSQSWDPPSPPLLWAFLIRRGTQKVKLSPRLIY